MNLQEKISHIQSMYDIIDVVDLDQWHLIKPFKRESWLRNKLQSLHRDEFKINQRIVFSMIASDEYKSESEAAGVILKNLIYFLNAVDITNFFVILITNAPDIEGIKSWIRDHSSDTTEITIEPVEDILKQRMVTTRPIGYQYNSSVPIKISVDDLSDYESFLLRESNTFCMYPWIHLHAYPTGEAYPCCHAEMTIGAVGNCRENTLEEIWNSDKQKQLRKDMLSETFNSTCNRCYEQENNGFFSGRQSANKHHGHHINRVEQTQLDGHVEKFEMTYWDIRFSNLCNLSCRSCGHIFSSSWYQDQAKLAGGDWKDRNTVLNYAGRSEIDMWEQLEPHLDYVEQIYFAGGEPLLMEEHYNILEELVRRKRFDVRLIYNTNFTHTKLKGKSVFEYWKQFDSVAVGASLDDAGPRAEYIRKGTDWAVVENNRREMLAVCPGVDFYISPTLSIMNAWHLPDFHQDWVKKGLIKAQDLNVNILQDPVCYRIDIATSEYKAQLATKFTDHINWLSGQDPLSRATVGFESAIKFMMATDNTHMIDTFWRKTHELDDIRKENILDIIPELAALK